MSQLETSVSNITRYNPEEFNQMQAKVTSGLVGVAELKSQIFKKQEEMERFPRQNSNCVEYFDRYQAKFAELDEKFKA